jgi:hypothetical protein
VDVGLWRWSMKRRGSCPWHCSSGTRLLVWPLAQQSVQLLLCCMYCVSTVWNGTISNCYRARWAAGMGLIWMCAGQVLLAAVAAKLGKVWCRWALWASVPRGRQGPAGHTFH